jgi:hypothetical protein
MKNGWQVSVVSANSQRVLLESLGSFVSSEQATLISLYAADRDGGGWDTAPFPAPPSGLGSLVLGSLATSSDLSSGLFFFGEASGTAESIYIRALPHGEPIEVGPIFSKEARSAGTRSTRLSQLSSPSASGNLQHVLFTILGPSSAGSVGPNFLWREIGDSTVENTGPLAGGLGFVSLYEYSGVERSSPTLVGVDEAGHLISQCGTSLGYPIEGTFGGTVDSEELYNAISADGSRTFFTAAAAAEGTLHNHCTSDKEGKGEGSGPPADELFARTEGSKTTAISLPSIGAMGDCSECSEGKPAGDPTGSVGEGSVFQGASSDGSKVFFLTTWPLLHSDGDHTMDLYEYNFNAPPHEKISQVSAGGVGDATPGQGAKVQGVARVSQDGSHVYFVAKGVLTANPRGGGCVSELSAAELAQEEATHEGRCRPSKEADNLYVYDTLTGATGFVATLSLADREAWQLKDSRSFDVTPDGRFALFTSTADLTTGDTSTVVSQVFEYNADNERITRISIGQNGFNNNGNTELYGASIAHPVYTGTENPAPPLTSISDDGSVVVFQSSDALTSEALTGFPNVYEYRDGSLSLLSDGQDRSLQLGAIPSTALVGMDGSGEDILFTTADQLVPQDGDTQLDVYDARVAGGFAPGAASAACEGEGCQGGLVQAPVFSTPVSASQPAGEEVVEASALKGAKSKVKPKKAPVRHRRKARARRKPKARAGHGRARTNVAGRGSKRR